MTGRTAAIVLAGGRSARFGRDKLVEPIDGRPMLDHVIERVRAVATDIVVVGRSDAPATEPGAFRVVGDDRPFEGPLAGLGAGLRALDPAIELVLVVGGDMPKGSLGRRQASTTPAGTRSCRPRGSARRG